jgi:hypothetical protein
MECAGTAGRKSEIRLPPQAPDFVFFLRGGIHWG